MSTSDRTDEGETRGPRKDADDDQVTERFAPVGASKKKTLPPGFAQRPEPLPPGFAEPLESGFARRPEPPPPGFDEALPSGFAQRPAPLPPGFAPRSERQSIGPNRPPPPPRPATMPPPSSAARPPTVPPMRPLPRPSDPLPPRDNEAAAQRQRLAQMATQLDQARSTMARQKHELDELRARLEEGDARLAALLAKQERAGLLEGRIDEIDSRREGLAEEVRRRFAEALVDAQERADSFAKLEERLRSMEEGSEAARLRMRLDRVTQRLDELERKLAAVERRQASLAQDAEAQLALAARSEVRLTRIESLFDELADEFTRERELSDLEGLRARLDDVEALVTKTGSDEAALRRLVSDQERAIGVLRESLVPTASSTPAPADGDDLTEIRGIGPKYARLLRELGIARFADVAALDEDGLQRVAGHLKISPARIHKAGWIEAAAKLAEGRDA